MSDRLLIIDKPSGPTSHDVVARVRRATGVRRVGHAGTLDPRGTGVLVVMVGRTTRLSAYLMDHDKSYSGRMVLGVTTDTQDAEGEVLERRDPSGVDRDRLDSVLDSFRGDIMQTPPMVSALKRGGVPLYELARQGIRVEREARPVTVRDLRIVSFDLPYVEFVIECSKGTYVRTLAADVGEQLGCGAHLDRLRRTRVGPFRVEEAVALADIMEAGDAWLELGVPPLGALPDLDVVTLSEEQAERVMDGGGVRLDDAQASGVSTDRALLTEDGAALMAVARVTRNGGTVRVDPEKVFVPPI
ncbi:MAG: tRNA pseudouridine(55) synthase TruB [Candidatus Eisenbacteria bacterium]|nr:tRNA pseudouridine(55) synthase TruB [Candidatus Eisenbacteria bacterium]